LDAKVEAKIAKDGTDAELQGDGAEADRKLPATEKRFFAKATLCFLAISKQARQSRATTSRRPLALISWVKRQSQPKSLIRMFGPRGNPQARKLYGIIGHLQEQARVELHVSQGPR
jgi:hypothetical protein